MNLRVGCEFGYDVEAPTPATVQVRPRFDPRHRLVRETWSTSPALALDEFTDLYGNSVKRLLMEPGDLVLRYDAVVEVPDEWDELGTDAPERSLLARPLRLEERQLAAPGVGADEREALGALDHVHAEVGGREVGDPIAVGDPERDVVEAGRVHSGQLTHPASVYFRRSTARWSCVLLIFERPLIFSRLAWL